MSSESVRIAIIDPDKCKPKKCNQECKRYCPINNAGEGKHCVEADRTMKIATISETLCTGCNICPKKCPFNAIKIINLPSSIDSQTIHRFGQNGFKLHRLPLPKPGKILGLVGSNGLGKSSAIKILGAMIKPNYGITDQDKAMNEIAIDPKAPTTGLKKLPMELQDYFKKLNKGEIKTVIKPQYVDLIPKEFQGKVCDFLKVNPIQLDQFQERIIKALDITKLLNRFIVEEGTVDGTTQLSGGELQRVAIASVCLRTDCNMFIFDEPSSYLDIKQRMEMAKVIQSILTENNYIMLIEHDLSILDYLSDYICTLYGDPGMYGIVSLPNTVKEGINIFLDGYIPSENMRFREYALKFKISDNFDDLEVKTTTFQYPAMEKTYKNFKLSVAKGEFKTSQVAVLLGENGTGKTTFIKLLAGMLQPDVTDGDKIPELTVSYKPQYINPKFDGSVRDLLFKNIGTTHLEPVFQTEITKPLKIEQLLDRNLKELSGGELQRVAILMCLAKPADIYLIDEPSAYLDSEQRLITAKIIKRFVMQKQKTAFVVEHDFMMASYLADKVIVFDGEPSVTCHTTIPLNVVDGMNQFLKKLDITFRRDRDNFRPRINKLNSMKDSEQKASGNYFTAE